MPRTVYDQHKSSFPNVSAYVVVDKLGNRVASVAIKFNTVLYAYVHVFGGPMTRGSAGGGGYDKTSAAVLHAVSKIKREDYGDFEQFRDHADAFKRMVDCGYGWERQLTDAGYRVYQVV